MSGTNLEEPELPTFYTKIAVNTELGRSKQQNLAAMPLPVAYVRAGEGRRIPIYSQAQVKRLRKIYGDKPRKYAPRKPKQTDTNTTNEGE
nr:MAG TPA: hypothetical protein [Caudoviricetes sp.]